MDVARCTIALAAITSPERVLGGLALIFVLMLFCAFFSSAETAYSFCNKIRIKQLAESKNKRAKAAMKIVDDFDGALVAILVGYNICNTLAASAATVMFISLLGNIGTLVSTIAITLMFYIFAETFPKSFAKANCDTYALAIAYPTMFFIKLFLPVSFVLTALSDALKKKISRLFPASPEFTDDDLQSIVESVEEEGGFDREEGDIIRSAIEFGDLKAKDVLCPKEKVVSLSVRLPESSIVETLLSVKYSRIPVYRDNPDIYIGFLKAEEYLVSVINGKKTDVRRFIFPPMYVSEETRLATVFEEMGKHKCHLAFVRNTEREVVGIVTMEDVLEEIVGDINDSDDSQIAAQNDGEGNA